MGELQRELTPSERRVLEMFAACEDYFNRRIQTVTLVMNDLQLKHFREGECSAIRYNKTKDASGNNKFDVRITAATYFKYAELIAKRIGMKVLTDGSLYTFDGIFIGNDYLRKFNYLKVPSNVS